MIRYYITDRTQLQPEALIECLGGPLVVLLECIAHQLAAGIEMIQIRERDLSTRDLYALAKQVMALPNPRGTRILVNDRADVALSVGAGGVHLRGNSIVPSRIRAIAPAGFRVGVSCHSLEDVRRASGEGASFAVLAPIYATKGKGPALGLGPLARAAQTVRIPVLALGGITLARIPECLDAGASGIAGISMFQGDGSTLQISKLLASPDPGTHGR